MPALGALTLLGMSLLQSQKQERTKEEMERDAKMSIHRLLNEFGSSLKANGAKLVAAIDIRYSTQYQDSFEAQLRSALQKAAEQNFQAPLNTSS